MDARTERGVIAALSFAITRLEKVGSRLKEAAIRLAAREGALRIRQRRGIVTPPAGIPRPSAQVARARTRVAFRNEHATADEKGRLRVCGCGAPAGRCLGLRVRR